MAPGEAPAITVVTPTAHAVYSGMVPALIAGRLAPDDVRIDVAALAERARAGVVLDRVVAIDPVRRRVATAAHGEIPWDVLSLDTGSRTAAAPGPAAGAHVVAVRPIERCIARIEEFVAAARAGSIAPRAAVVGAGAGGIEIAFALARRLAGLRGARIAIVERGAEVLRGASAAGRARVERELGARGIEILAAAGEVTACPAGLAVGDGRIVEAALAIWATGARAPGMFAAGGLPVDDGGFVLVDDRLGAVGRPDDVFAAGDCARMASHPAMPRAGVFAVRQGPILFANLRDAALGRRPARTYRPQSAFLSLLATGDGGAVALWRGRSASGRWVGAWKDRIDRRFVARYAPPLARSVRPPAAADPGGTPAMAGCGGCAAKLDAAALAGLLAGLPRGPGAGVVVGLDAPDDAAILSHPPGAEIVVTLDGFPPFSADLHACGEVAAVNAASDVFAMGGEPTAALALVSPGAGTGAAREAELGLLLGGLAAGLARLDIPLVGGHTLASPGPLVALAMLGRVAPGRAMTRAGARPGDALVLTKPLGTGVILAAARAGECPAQWIEGALASMRIPNGPAARVLHEAGVRCCIDVSGFGLAGHLAEAMDASATSAELAVDAVALLGGVRELLAAGWRSSAHAGNRALLDRIGGGDRAGGGPELEALFDPQTSGGLLAAVPRERLAAVLESLRAAGCAARVVGRVLARAERPIDIVPRPTDPV